MNYSIRDFKTGQKIDTPAKTKLWDRIFNKTFGGCDCALNQYERYSSNGTWQSYKISGMITYLNELTGGKYGKEHPEIKTVSGTLASQFKKKFSDIYYLMYNRSINTDTSVLDRHFNISAEKNMENNLSSDIKIDYSKSYAILGELYSKNLSLDETKFIAETLMVNCKKNYEI